MVSITGIAASGLLAQSQRLNASASNVANNGVKGAIPGADGKGATGQKQAYQPIGVVQDSVSLGGQPAGTRATYQPVNPAYRPEYDPGADYANADGLVAAPNVDFATETVNQITAASAYKANAQVLRTEDELVRSILDAKV